MDSVLLDLGSRVDAFAVGTFIIVVAGANMAFAFADWHEVDEVRLEDHHQVRYGWTALSFMTWKLAAWT